MFDEADSMLAEMTAELVEYDRDGEPFIPVGSADRRALAKQRLDKTTVADGEIEALRLAAIAECDELELWRHDGARDMASWVSAQVHCGYYKASRYIEASHEIESLPYVRQALLEGRLGIDKVLELVRFATPETEMKLVKWARGVSVGAIKNRADMDARKEIEEAAQADLQRSVSWSWSEDRSMLSLHADLPAEQGEVVIKAIDRVADSLPHDPNEDLVLNLQEDMPLAARRADALLALCSQQIAHDADADRATVVVRAPLSALRGDGTNIALDSGAILHPEVGRRLSCDCRLEVVSTDEHDCAVGVDRASRNVPLWLQRELRHRFRTCTFPGCESKRFLQAHHIWHWEDGGPTNLENLLLVCMFHHKQVHEHGWTVELNDDTTVDWFGPDGTRYVPGPKTIEVGDELPPDEHRFSG